MIAKAAPAAVLIVLFACLLFIALKDLLQLFESSRFGDTPILLLCVAVCVGWIAFLAPLCLPRISRPSRPLDFAGH
jgi:hypothetical protein